MNENDGERDAKGKLNMTGREMEKKAQDHVAWRGIVDEELKAKT